MNRLRTIAGATITLLTVAASLIASGASATAETTLVPKTYVDSSGVIHYHYDPATRPGATIRIETGTRTASGTCAYSGSQSGRSGGTTITIVDEMTYDPAACSRTVSVATYQRSQLPSVVAASIQPPTGSAQASTSTSSGPRAATTSSFLATEELTIWYSDPVGIVVTQTHLSRTWDDTGYWYDSHTWNWYDTSGWQLTYSSQVDNASYGDTIGDFYNGSFCFYAPTYTDHYHTQISTDPSGYWTYYYSADKGGGCSDLLGFNYSVTS